MNVLPFVEQVIPPKHFDMRLDRLEWNYHEPFIVTYLWFAWQSRNLRIEYLNNLATNRRLIDRTSAEFFVHPMASMISDDTVEGIADWIRTTFVSTKENASVYEVSRVIHDGILDRRFKRGSSKPRPMPGVPHTLRVDLFSCHLLEMSVSNDTDEPILCRAALVGHQADQAECEFFQRHGRWPGL